MSISPAAGKTDEKRSVRQAHRVAIDVADHSGKVLISLRDYQHRRRDMERRERLQDKAMHSAIKAALKGYRVKKGWNQATMADFLHISKENYQKYELDATQGKLVKVPVVVFMTFCVQTNQNPLDVVYPRSSRAVG